MHRHLISIKRPLEALDEKATADFSDNLLSCLDIFEGGAKWANTLHAFHL